MKQFRLHENHLVQFKSLVNAIADGLPSNAPSWRGAKLYNAFSRALEHKDFNALKIDSKTYGKGSADVNDSLLVLGSPDTEIHRQLGVTWNEYHIAYRSALRGQGEEPLKSLSNSPLAQELGLTEGELSLLEWESSVNESSDGFPYNYILTFSQDCPSHILAKIRGLSASLEVDVSMNAFDRPEPEDDQDQEVGESIFYERLSELGVEESIARNQIEAYFESESFLEAEAQLSSYIAESGLLFEEAPELTSYKYFVGLDVMSVLATGTMHGTRDVDSDRLITHHSTSPVVTLYLNVAVPSEGDRSLTLDWEQSCF